MRAIQSGFLSFTWDVLAKILQFSGVLGFDKYNQRFLQEADHSPPASPPPKVSFYLSPKFYIEK